MNDDRLKPYLRERLDGYEHPVDDTAWSSASLDAYRRRSRKRLLIAAFGISAAVIAAFVVAPFLPESGREPAYGPEAQHTAAEIPATALPDKIPAAPAVSDEQYGSSEASAFTGNDRRSQRRIIAEAVGEREAKSGADEAFRDTPEDGEPGDSRAEKEQSKDERGESRSGAGGNIRYDSRPPGPDRRRGSRGDQTSLMLAVNGSGLAKREGEYSKPTIGTALEERIFAGDGTPVDMSDPHYDFPVTVGLTVRKKVANGFAVESGLIYTWLHTTVKNADIKLHYLGIPIKAVYMFNTGHTVTFYGSAGGAVEKQIAGKLLSPNGNRSLKNPRLQYSVGVSAGVDLRLGNHAGLFVEPGVSYFFDDGGNIPTIRRARPLNFNLQVGLRFSLD